MANLLRREIEWTVGDTTYTLRLTMNDLAVIEQTPVGKQGIVALFNRMVVENQYGLAEVATVLQRGLASGMPNRKWTITDIYNLIDEAGFVDAAQAVILLLTKRLTNQTEDGQGEPPAPLAPTTQPPTGAE